MKFQASSQQFYWERDPNIDVFVQILRGFWEHLFHNCPWSQSFWIFKPSSMFRYHNKDIKMTSIAAILLTILPTLKILFVCWDNFGSHHPEQVLQILNIFKENTENTVFEVSYAVVKRLCLLFTFILRVC